MQPLVKESTKEPKDISYTPVTDKEFDFDAGVDDQIEWLYKNLMSLPKKFAHDLNVAKDDLLEAIETSVTKVDQKLTSDIYECGGLINEVKSLVDA